MFIRLFVRSLLLGGRVFRIRTLWNEKFFVYTHHFNLQLKDWVEEGRMVST